MNKTSWTVTTQVISGYYTQLSAAGLAVYVQLYIQAETFAHCIQLKILNIVQVNNFSSLKWIKIWECIRGGRRINRRNSVTV